jgi:hypothetical protein
MTKFEREMLKSGPKGDRWKKGLSTVERLEKSRAKAGMGGDRWKRKERVLGISNQRKTVGIR